MMCVEGLRGDRLPEPDRAPAWLVSFRDELERLR